jgi:hypothetical protein
MLTRPSADHSVEVVVTPGEPNSGVPTGRRLAQKRTAYDSAAYKLSGASIPDGELRTIRWF